MLLVLDIMFFVETVEDWLKNMFLNIQGRRLYNRDRFIYFRVFFFNDILIDSECDGFMEAIANLVVGE